MILPFSISPLLERLVDGSYHAVEEESKVVPFKIMKGRKKAREKKQMSELCVWLRGDIRIRTLQKFFDEGYIVNQLEKRVITYW